MPCWSFIHLSAWNWNSAKFVFWGFSEVHTWLAKKVSKTGCVKDACPSKFIRNSSAYVRIGGQAGAEVRVLREGQIHHKAGLQNRRTSIEVGGSLNSRGCGETKFASTISTARGLPFLPRRKGA